MKTDSENTLYKKSNVGLLGRAILPVAILAAVAVVIVILFLSKPEPKKRGPSRSSGLSVDVIEVKPQSFQPQILSYGIVQARTRSKLVAQVSGRVEYMSERFRDGGFFKKNDLLLKLESTDYEIALHVAEASLAEAEKQLQEEIAEAEQAEANWKILGKQSAASALTLREPQLKAARANVKSQQALFKQAQVNLARTEIRAPFDGRVLTTDVDLGQVASNNSVLGEIYATDAIEIKLPVKNTELSLLNLPETYAHSSEGFNTDKLPIVKIHSNLAGKEVWLGRIIRTSGSIDDTSRQLNVIARIDNPFGEKAEGRFPLKIGQYVTAEISGRSQENIILVPNEAIYQGSYVYIYQSNAVYRRDIKIGWQNSEIAVVADGVNFGDAVVVSPLGQVASGTSAHLGGMDSGKKTPKSKPVKPVTSASIEN